MRLLFFALVLALVFQPTSTKAADGVSFVNEGVVDVMTLKPLDGGRTLVHAASLGFGTDEESVAMRRFFEAGNQQTIQSIQKHFAVGR